MKLQIGEIVLEMYINIYHICLHKPFDRYEILPQREGRNGKIEA